MDLTYLGSNFEDIFIGSKTKAFTCEVTFAGNRVYSIYTDVSRHLNVVLKSGDQLGLLINVNKYGMWVKKPKFDKESYRVVDEELSLKMFGNKLGN